MQYNRPYIVILVKGEEGANLLEAHEKVPEDKWEQYSFATNAERDAFTSGIVAESGDGFCYCTIVHPSDYKLLEELDLDQFKIKHRNCVKFEVDIELTEGTPTRGWDQVQANLAEAVLRQIENSENGLAPDEGEALTEDVVVSCEHTGLGLWIRQKSNGRFFGETL